jgi:hypothetical protein
MRFAYLTTDEVNHSLALEMAKACKVTLNPLAPKDGPPDAGYDAVLCDWDSWPVEGRNDFVAMLSCGPQPRRFAVHGYNLNDHQLTELLSKGVVVHRVLQTEMFQLLSNAVISAKEQQGRQVRGKKKRARSKKEKKTGM